MPCKCLQCAHKLLDVSVYQLTALITARVRLQDAAGDRVNLHMEGGGITTRIALRFSPHSLATQQVLAALYATMPAEAARLLHASLLPFVGMREPHSDPAAPTSATCISA